MIRITEDPEDDKKSRFRTDEEVDGVRNRMAKMRKITLTTQNSLPNFGLHQTQWTRPSIHMIMI
jgi:hypothetical protein